MNNWALIVFWFGAFADFWTTRKGLEAGFREGNPVIKYILDNLPYDSEVELAGIKFVFFAVALTLGAPTWFWFVMGAAQIVVAYFNFQKLRKARVL